MGKLITVASLVVLAAIFKAVADTLMHHYGVSIFNDLDPQWWNPEVSWQHVKFIPLTKYRPDAWHLANSGMIVSFCLAVALHKPYKSWWLETLILGTVFILSFNLFYNQILIS